LKRKPNSIMNVLPGKSNVLEVRIKVSSSLILLLRTFFLGRARDRVGPRRVVYEISSVRFPRDGGCTRPGKDLVSSPRLPPISFFPGGFLFEYLGISHKTPFSLSKFFSSPYNFEERAQRV